MRTHAATRLLVLILSQRLVADAYTRCDKAACTYFVAAICRTNSNEFEFVRQIAGTKFCRSDNDFHMSHEAICCSNLSRRRVAAICRILCLGVNSSKCLLFKLNELKKIESKEKLNKIKSWEKNEKGSEGLSDLLNNVFFFFYYY